MKLHSKILMAVAGCALVGGSAVLAVMSQPSETKATDYSSYTFYLYGNLNGVNCWNSDDEARRFTYDATNSVFLLQWDFVSGDTFKVVNTTNSENLIYSGWHSNIGDAHFTGPNRGDDVSVGFTGTYTITIQGVMATHGSNSDYWSVAPDNIHVWTYSENSTWTEASASTKLGIWGGPYSSYTLFASDYTYQATKTDSSKVTYSRFTIPVDVDGIKCERYNPDGTIDWVHETEDMTTITANSVYEIYRGVDEKWYMTSPKGAIAKTVSGEMLGKAIDLVKTCSSNSITGFNAYPTLNTNFYANLVDDADLTGTISDYDYAEYVGRYVGLSPTASTVQIGYKWSMIESMYNASRVSPVQIVNQNAAPVSSTAVIAAVSVVGSIAAAGGLIFIRKRRIF